MNQICRAIVAVLFAVVLLQPAIPAQAAGPPLGRVDCIDTHNHLFGRRGRPGNFYYQWAETAREAVKAMDQAGIRKMMVMPPPMSDDHMTSAEGITDIAPHFAAFGTRFVIMGGGATLNPLIVKAAHSGKTTPRMKAEFKKQAEKLVELGVKGFGEFASEHLSLNYDHPYLSVPPDHPLFLLLADLSAKYDLPIDLHMEAVPARMKTPERLTSKNNPDYLEANIPAFERLLKYNQKARIIWSHLGWCNTGARTPELVERLFSTHPNLYMNIKISPRDCSEAGSLVDFRSWTLKPEWLKVIRRHSGWILIGSDQFYDTTGRLFKTGPRQPGGGEKGKPQGPGFRSGPKTSIGPVSLWPTMRFLFLLPPDLAEEIGVRNAKRVFRLE